jgi:hypothetical protein
MGVRPERLVHRNDVRIVRDGGMDLLVGHAAEASPVCDRFTRRVFASSIVAHRVRPSRPICRYDVPFAGIAISVDDRHLNAIHKSDSANSHLAIVETIVYPLNRGAVEYSCSILKRNPVPTDVGSVLVGVPGESHS